MSVDIAFSKRFENIMRIATKLAQDREYPSKIKDVAQQIEGKFLTSAETAEAYQDSCDNYVNAHPTIPIPPTDDVDSGAIPEEVFNTHGPTFGSYEWATFHTEGITSTIYKAKDKRPNAADLLVALKVMSPDHLQAPHNARKELRILNRAHHQHIIPLLDSFQQAGGRLIFVFPFLRQDLENLLHSDSLTRQTRKLVFTGLFSALEYLHLNGIIHRDIKPSNILLKSRDGPVYLIDFGIAWDPKDPDSEPANKKITDVGTTCYRPPEILFGDTGYGPSLDMWSAGCVVAEIVSRRRKPFFDGGEVGSELALIKSMFSTLGTPTDEDWPSAKGYPSWGKFRFTEFEARSWREILPGASSSAIDFVKRTVRFEVTERLTAAEALRHQLIEDL